MGNPTISGPNVHQDLQMYIKWHAFLSAKIPILIKQNGYTRRSDFIMIKTQHKCDVSWHKKQGYEINDEFSGYKV